MAREAVMRPTMFIDVEASITGLSICKRLERDKHIGLRSITPEYRKDLKAKRALPADVDLAVLYLPDEAARAAMVMAKSLSDGGPCILDASAAHRIAPRWTYGFPEIAAGQAAAIADARRVTNPGYYSTGGIGLLRPSVEANLIPVKYPISVNAVSCCSGGNKSMVEDYKVGQAPSF